MKPMNRWISSISRRSAEAESERLGRNTARLLHHLLEEATRQLTKPAGSSTPSRRRVRVFPLEDSEVADLWFTVDCNLARGNAARAAESVCKLGELAERRQAFKLAARAYDGAIALAPSHARAWYKAGRLARRCADYDRAETLFNRAIVLGTEAADWHTVAVAYAGLGNSQKQAGALERAEISHMRSLATALDHRLSSLVADGYHNLAVLSFMRGHPDRGVSYARQALDLHFDDRERIAVLASDLAYAWLTSGRAPERALPIFEEILHLVPESARRLVVLGSIAYASGKTGNGSRFDSVVSEIEELLASTPLGENHAPTLLDAAHGAVALQRMAQATGFATRSRAVAHKRGETHAIETADFFLRFISREVPFSSAHTALEDVFSARRVDDLVHELIEALR